MPNLQRLAFLIWTLFIVFSCQHTEEEKYIFFLHNRFLEEHTIDELHPLYGKTEYLEILEAFTEAGFTVISEQRQTNVNARDYAMIITEQVNELLEKGVRPNQITIVGTSKGGYIAQYVSTLAQNPELNFVFIASFRNADIDAIPGINFCGNILTIFDKSDPFGVSAFERLQNTTCHISNFKEIELNTGMGHGFLFKPMKEWIAPTTQWANAEYDSIMANATVYRSEKLEIIQLSKDQYIHRSFLKEYNNYPCNGLIYVNKGEAVVLDSPTNDSTSVELIAWIQNDLSSQIKAIVINHFHRDCLGSLAAFHEIGVPSHASISTIELALSEKVQKGAIPSIAFKDSLIIQVGDSYIENRYFGAGHSPDNIVSYVSSTKTLFGGCLIKANGANKGNLSDANTDEWPVTVQKIKAKYSSDLQYVVPGHGDPGGEELLDYTINLFDTK